MNYDKVEFVKNFSLNKKGIKKIFHFMKLFEK